jgi:hypothetical protein
MIGSGQHWNLRFDNITCNDKLLGIVLLIGAHDVVVVGPNPATYKRSERYAEWN